MVTNTSLKAVVPLTARTSATLTSSPSWASQKSSAYFEGSNGRDSMLPPGCGAYSPGTVFSVITTGSGSSLPRDSVVHVAPVSWVVVW